MTQPYGDRHRVHVIDSYRLAVQDNASGIPVDKLRFLFTAGSISHAWDWSWAHAAGLVTPCDPPLALILHLSAGGVTSVVTITTVTTAV